MGHGGGVLPLGASYRAGYLMVHLESRKTPAASTNPKIGETSRTLKTFVACSQSTPEVPLPLVLISWFASPTPIIDPTMVCELEAGSPNHQVLRFQMMAAISRAKTMAKPAPALTCRISSTGSSVITVKATVPLETSTPVRLHSPDQTTAMLGSSECV